MASDKRLAGVLADRFYTWILKRNVQELSQLTKRGTPAVSLQNVLVQLQKCCNHPYLIQGARDAIRRGMSASQAALSELDLMVGAVRQSSPLLHPHAAVNRAADPMVFAVSRSGAAESCCCWTSSWCTSARTTTVFLFSPSLWKHWIFWKRT